MAENSLDAITYKRSDNDKADLITLKLQQYATLLEVVSRHPEILNEYKEAVCKNELQKKVSLSAKQRSPGTDEIGYLREGLPGI